MKHKPLPRLLLPFLFTMLALGAAQVEFVALSQTAGAQDAKPKISLPETDEGLPGAGPIRRYDWFRNLWTERRTAWSKRVAEDQKSLVFLGDSITQGWGDDFKKNFPGVKAANRGISGDTTRGMLIRLRDDVLVLNPTGVVLLMGTNDLEEGAEPETIAGNLKLILAELKKHDPKMPVILCQVFPSSATKKRPADKIKEINKLYAAAVKGDAQVTLIETWTLFANAEGDAKVEEFPDVLHPNDLGYAKWAAALRPILATLDFIETADDAFVMETWIRKSIQWRRFYWLGIPGRKNHGIEGHIRWQANDHRWKVYRQTWSSDRIDTSRRTSRSTVMDKT